MTSNDENEKLDAKVLESWKVASPPSGFADGVLEKLEKIGTEETESPTGLQKWLWPSLCAVFVLALLPRWFPCLLYTSPSPRDQRGSRMPSSA